MNASPAVPVLFVLLPNTLMLDLAGPAEVLRLATKLALPMGPQASAHGADGAPQQFALSYIGPTDTVQTSIGLPLYGIAPLPAQLPPGAIVVLVGTSPGIGAQGPDGCVDAAADAVSGWLQRVVAPSGLRLMCICSGALLAARAGLLDGRQCTTHHSLCATLQAAAPRAKVLEDRLYVTDGHVSTSAGITAGIDMMLHLVAELAGPRAACHVARDMVVYMRRGGADPQLSPWISGRNHLHRALHRVQDAVAADPARDWRADEMAQIACSSTRHLGRLFREHVGSSPLDYLQRLRAALARELIAQSSLGMESIAERAGFGSARHMRRVWRKFEQEAPSEGRHVRGD